MRTKFHYLFIALVLPLGLYCQAITLPERFGVVDVIPNNQSGETDQNSEPSLGVGVDGNYGKFVLHAFMPGWNNPFFASADSGIHWMLVEHASSSDVTLDWNSGSNAYASIMPLMGDRISVLTSSDPSTGAIFSSVHDLFGSVDQPWLKVVNVSGVDHIYVGLGDFDYYPGNATVAFSLDGGSKWTIESVEKTTPGLGDGTSARLAISSDGKTVYALFERYQTNASNPNLDYAGDMVLVRDDNSGLNGFTDLPGNGTVVTQNIVLPCTTCTGPYNGTSLGSERVRFNCDVAINPSKPNQVYAAYTEVLGTTPVIRLQYSSDSGKTFSLVHTTSIAAANPALAVASDGTVGLLFAAEVGNNLEIHFFKADYGDFTKTNERVLARFPDNNPVLQYTPYIGDYFQLKAAGDNFYGTFCASGDPQPSHFPSGVFYQRNVEVSGIVTNGIWLLSPGTLIDLASQPVAPSIDPFFFYDIAPAFINLPILEYVPQWFIDPSDPLSGVAHLTWPVLPPGYPQFQLESTPELGPSASWAGAGVGGTIQANGRFETPIQPSQQQQFFRLSQNVAAGAFNLFASADSHGSLIPGGILAVDGTGSQMFTATPSNQYAIGNWYVDGIVVQSGSPTLTLSNISAEHTLMVTFVASNDLAVALEELPSPVLVGSNLLYVAKVQNTGLNPVTGVTLTNTLPLTLSFVSVVSSQGSVTNSSNLVTASLGVLSPGALATVTITATANSEGPITDTVTVACSQFEPNLTNNTATDYRTVMSLVAITNQPSPQSVPVGGTANFTVGASGTPPLTYQWSINGTAIGGATNATLMLTNVTATEAGSYGVAVFQIPEPEDPFEADSIPATLTVLPVGAVQQSRASVSNAAGFGN